MPNQSSGWTRTSTVAVAVLAAASPALAGTVTGNAKVASAADAERTLVYVDTVPAGSFSPPSGVARLSQKGSTFRPALLAVVRGTQVDMTNDDWVAHNVFSKSEAKSFDLGLYAQDTQKLVTFDKVGVVQVFCSIHPRMNAVVVVLQNPFFAKPSRDGRFSLAGVPAGSHQLKLFRPGSPPQVKTVVVPATGSVDVQFQ
ncbi:MAG: methylamine utilization protein [bacterium]